MSALSLEVSPAGLAGEAQGHGCSVPATALPSARLRRPVSADSVAANRASGLTPVLSGGWALTQTAHSERTQRGLGICSLYTGTKVNISVAQKESHFYIDSHLQRICNLSCKNMLSFTSLPRLGNSRQLFPLCLKCIMIENAIHHNLSGGGRGVLWAEGARRTWETGSGCHGEPGVPCSIGTCSGWWCGT